MQVECVPVENARLCPLSHSVHTPRCSGMKCSLDGERCTMFVIHKVNVIYENNRTFVTLVLL